MGKKTVSYALAVIAAVSVLASCPSAVSRGGESGVVSVNFGASARDVLYAPPFPVFSSATVTISGDDMTTVSASLVDGKATLEVPAGSRRVVTVDAVPDWAASKATNPDKYFTTLAKRYGGSTTVDVKIGETVSAAVQLGMTESRLLLPDLGEGYVYMRIADSIDSLSSTSNVSVGGLNTWTVDGYGRLYVSNDSYIYRLVDPSAVPDITIPTAEPEGPGVFPMDLAIDDLNGRLYYVDVAAGSPPGFFNGSNESLVLLDGSSVSAYEVDGSSLIAAGEDGVIYITAYIPEDSSYILKCSVGNPTGSDPNYSAVPTIIQAISFKDAGLTYGEGYSELQPCDMIVVGDRLYITGYEYSLEVPIRSRGKVVSISTDFKDIKTLGWCGDENPYPTDPSKQFYGPNHFIGIAPKKLYVSDAGFISEYSTVSRVVEVSLSPLAITKVATLPGGMTFIEY